MQRKDPQVFNDVFNKSKDSSKEGEEPYRKTVGHATDERQRHQKNAQRFLDSYIHSLWFVYTLNVFFSGNEIKYQFV